jgi:hypothetical protein
MIGYGHGSQALGIAVINEVAHRQFAVGQRGMHMEVHGPLSCSIPGRDHHGIHYNTPDCFALQTIRVLGFEKLQDFFT